MISAFWNVNMVICPLGVVIVKFVCNRVFFVDRKELL